MDVTAKLKNLRMAPRKVRLLADLVRGRSVDDALATLRFQIKTAATPLRKLIESAIANAENNFKLDKKNLFIKKITVDDAIVMKRYRPRAFGRAAVIRKRGSHIIITLSTPVEKVSSGSAAATKPVKPRTPQGNRAVDSNKPSTDKIGSLSTSQSSPAEANQPTLKPKNDVAEMVNS